jgi:transposase-like protein
LTFPGISPALHDPLTEVLRRGAVQLLAQAVEAEVEQWIASHAHLTDAQGHRQVVRNGHAEPRKVVTGLGPMSVCMPRVHDRRTPAHGREHFTSNILPPYLRKARSIDELIPWLYLKGVSTGDFSEALSALLGPQCPGLSASTVTRLIEQWQDQQRQWWGRDLSQKHYVYVWADGIHFNVRLEEDRTCILVLMGATPEGVKELIAVQDGYRESEQSWHTHTPAERWMHLRTTNPIESTFATVRLRHDKTKGNGSRRACLAMAFKLCESAHSRWRRLNGHELIQDVIAGVTFTDGEKQQAS